MRIAARVAQSKAEHPERYCEVDRCLWRTDSPRCPRHNRRTDAERRVAENDLHHYFNQAWADRGPDRRSA